MAVLCVAASLPMSRGGEDGRPCSHGSLPARRSSQSRVRSASPLGSSRGFSMKTGYGTSWWLVLHKVSDLAAVGAAGSEQARVAQSLLEDLEIRVVYAQSQGVRGR